MQSLFSAFGTIGAHRPPARTAPPRSCARAAMLQQVADTTHALPLPGMIYANLLSGLGAADQVVSWVLRRPALPGPTLQDALSAGFRRRARLPRRRQARRRALPLRAAARSSCCSG